jgi:SAM-dependent methyltransferase
MNLQLDRIARRFVPSTVLISQNEPLMRLMDATDRPIAAVVKSYRGLPPNRYRIRIGTGNRLILNHRMFLDIGRESLIFMATRGFLAWDSNVVDIGCGCGRLAIALKRGIHFRGTYHGTDVDADMIAWCHDNLADERFSFEHVDMLNTLYNPTGSAERYRFAKVDGSADLVCSQSVFTHLLEEPVRDYIAEAHRLLINGGTMAMTVFCLEHVQKRPEYLDRWSFQHRIGAAYVENREYAEAAVAYRHDDLISFAGDAGFASAEVLAAGPQSWLVARR